MWWGSLEKGSCGKEPGKACAQQHMKNTGPPSSSYVCEPSLEADHALEMTPTQAGSCIAICGIHWARGIAKLCLNSLHPETGNIIWISRGKLLNSSPIQLSPCVSELWMDTEPHTSGQFPEWEEVKQSAISIIRCRFGAAWRCDCGTNQHGMSGADLSSS